MSNYYGVEYIEELWGYFSSHRFSTMQEAQDNVDRFLLRMQRMISFL